MSVNVDPSSWRLKTEGGIPYKLMEGFPRGTYTKENATAEEQYLVRASDLDAFVLESFPSSTFLRSSYFFARGRTFPGKDTFFTKTVSYEVHTAGKPIDPFGQDPDAPANTYGNIILLTIVYETGKPNDNENDPETFLEISADAAGEFLSVPGRGGWGSMNPSAEDEVQGINVPITIVFPEIQWSVRWPRVIRSYVRDTLMPSMRSKLGHINNAEMPMLFGAVKDTIMFMGFSLREQFTWRDAELPSTEIDMKFLEKHQEKLNGEIVGHNHFYREDTGDFEPLFNVNGEIYSRVNLSDMFPSPDGPVGDA